MNMNEAMRLETVLFLCKEFFLGKIHCIENKEVQQYCNMSKILTTEQDVSTIVPALISDHLGNSKKWL